MTNNANVGLSMEEIQFFYLERMFEIHKPL